jgi:hypothetical protein
MGWRVATSHRLIAPSSLEDASVLPSGLNVMRVKTPAPRVNVCPRGWRLLISHSRTAVFVPPEASILPSGLKATLATSLAVRVSG